MSYSDEYRDQLRQVHSEIDWGTTGARNAGIQVAEFIRKRSDIRTVLDFGAGHGSLGQFVTMYDGCRHIDWYDYDPGVEAISELPGDQFDLVVTSDVLEHIEPDHVEATIEELRGLSRKYMWHHIATCEDSVTLPDGRNSHLSVHQPPWWVMRFDHPDWLLMSLIDGCQRKKNGWKTWGVLQYDRIGKVR